MFDTVNVAESLIKKCVKDQDFLLKPLGGYYSFQTKDLDNFMGDYYIEKDKTFKLKKQEYTFVPPSQNEKTDGLYNFGRWDEVGDPEVIVDTRTCYINFYDFSYSKEERVYYTFTAHVKDGKLAEQIKLKSIERTNLKEEQERNNSYKTEWQRIQTTWEWNLANFIFAIRNSIRKLFVPLSRVLDQIENALREKARKNYENT